MNIHYEIERATAYFRKEAARKGEPATSRLFIVLDHGGGWRIVVTPFSNIKYHIGSGERFIKVPKIRIAEPVEWDDIPRTIRLAQSWAVSRLSARNDCGACGACCFILPIKDEKLTKPQHEPCTYLCAGACRIHPIRPQTCKAYECEWLKSQRVNDRMPLKMRPDKCGVIFQTATAANNYDPDVIEAHPDLRWSTNPFDADNVREHIAALEKYGKRIVYVTRYVGDA